MKSLIVKLWDWINGLLRKKQPTPEPLPDFYHFVYLSEFPIGLKEKNIYIEYDDMGNNSALFLCPCGCREKIQLNLIEGVRPLWRIQKGQRATISPSINRGDNCKSHFYVRNGQINWC